MSTAANVDRPGTSMWRASERFELCGPSCRAAELPDVDDTIPFGLTRTTIVRPTKLGKFDRAQATYDPISQMSRVNGGDFVILAKRTDVYCWEQTTEDMQRYRDKVVDGSKND